MAASSQAPPADDALSGAAADAGLHYVGDAAPGIRRVRCGRGFRYLHADGTAVRDRATLHRIRALAIPPAYREVWICASARGHLQATGRDARGRKQYRYHPQWRTRRDSHKFDRLAAFAAALPRLRRAVRADLALPGLPQPKALAAVVRIMSATLLRVGNAEYARDNGSFGLTTLRNRHARFLADGLRLHFPGKGGRVQDVDVHDRRLARLVRGMHQLPGQALFQYRDGDGVLQPVDSGAVNAYLRERMGEDFTAKDFRTWGATLAAFRLLAATPLPDPPSARALADAERSTVAEVAALLGNTAAVCRTSYIDPCVFPGWRDGRLHAAAGNARGARQWETAARRFLVRAHRASAGSRAPG
ncbi:DNA topoisomerase [Pseudoxanthomonas broegbernensis]|uniref:DNA topoisomerase n=1 Tax=Pseudoxanthomonas broegbernensis TaxID=83619 RepID=A0A7V8GM83_9GAMM|nr:DNA topoisomerase IB [Pseudoxanthomonas broegbernensis]KAF1686334.1 DNA topoisomerase [Pseudoxanthomonas broegbernensis]MBB6064024.1 DNA topoisomerase IB [Pseudoxanthomonas broegbernensis]